jgi:hypothetical protein
MRKGFWDVSDSALSRPRVSKLRPAKEQIIIAGVVLITIIALKVTYAQFCSNFRELMAKNVDKATGTVVR